jgi:hypothetical protein
MFVKVQKKLDKVLDQFHSEFLLILWVMHHASAKKFGQGESKKTVRPKSFAPRQTLFSFGFG